MSLSLTVLGSSGTYAGPGNACSGYLVRSGTSTVWIDVGPGTLANLQRHISVHDVDAIVISHCHPDHWVELPVVRNLYKYIQFREGVPVYGTAETREMAEAIVADGLAPTFDWTDISDGVELSVGDLDFTFSGTDHPVETLAVAVESGGRAFGYSADTGPGWSFAKFGRPIDLALCEATLLVDQEGTSPHLSSRQAGEIAADAEVKQLILTHLWPGSDPDVHVAEAATTFDGAIEVAAVNETYAV